MPALSVYEYTLIRIVPRIERGEYVNVGVILLCRAQRFLDCRITLDPARLRALAADLDLELIGEQLDHIGRICAGGVAAGPFAELPGYERFRWLSAPRSTIIQPAPAHSGLCSDPAAELNRLFVWYMGG